jgi:hypothetical protein
MVLASSSPNNYQSCSPVGLVGVGSGSMIAEHLEASYEANKRNISNAVAAGPLK